MTPFLLDKLIFTTDLSATEGAHVIARRASASSLRVPRVGEEVFMQDFEGNGCSGVVAEVADRTVLITPMLETWEYTEIETTPTWHPISATGIFSAVPNERSVFAS